ISPKKQSGLLPSRILSLVPTTSERYNPICSLLTLAARLFHPASAAGTIFKKGNASTGGVAPCSSTARAHVGRVEAGAAHAVHGGEDDGGGVPPHVVVIARRVAEEVGEGLRGLGVLDGEDGVDAVDGEEGLDYAALDAPGGAVGEEKEVDIARADEGVCDIGAGAGG
ncbi:hypothetical protein N0V92_013952, partial [Colletotrichum tropicale]